MPNVFFGLPSGTGSTYSASDDRPIDWLWVTSREKNCFAFLSRIVTFSWRLLFGTSSTCTVMSPPLTNPFLAAAASAYCFAWSNSGIHTTPARAAASAARLISADRVYQLPKSTVNAAKISMITSVSVMNTATKPCSPPRSECDLISCSRRRITSLLRFQAHH